MKTKRIKVTKEHRLAAAALAILDKQGPPLRMLTMCTSEEHVCGTTCCIAGHAVLLDPKGRKPSPSVLTYKKADRIEDLAFDFYDAFGNDGRYVFHSDWPNDRRQGAARSLYLLENGRGDPESPAMRLQPIAGSDYKAPVPRNIRQRLRAHLHPEHPLYLPPRIKSAKT